MGSLGRRLTALEQAVEVAWRTEQVITVTRMVAIRRGLGQADTDRAIANAMAVLDAWSPEHERQVRSGRDPVIVATELALELGLVSAEIADHVMRERRRGA